MLHLPRHFPWWPKSDGLIDVAYRVGMTVSNIDARRPLFRFGESEVLPLGLQVHPQKV